MPVKSFDDELGAVFSNIQHSEMVLERERIESLGV